MPRSAAPRLLVAHLYVVVRIVTLRTACCASCDLLAFNNRRDAVIFGFCWLRHCFVRGAIMPAVKTLLARNTHGSPPCRLRASSFPPRERRCNVLFSTWRGILRRFITRRRFACDNNTTRRAARLRGSRQRSARCSAVGMRLPRGCGHTPAAHNNAQRTTTPYVALTHIFMPSLVPRAALPIRISPGLPFQRSAWRRRRAVVANLP